MKRLFSIASILVVISMLFAGSASATPGNNNLVPGLHVDYNLTVPVNIYYVGFTPADIDTGDVSFALPSAYEPVVRYPEFYGISGRDMGLRYNFTYNQTFTSPAFNARFFSYLHTIGVPGGLTFFQNEYNNMANNILDVTGDVLYIPAVSVENWLATNLRINPKSYNIVYINWYDDPSFQFHVYTKTDEPDPDTGYNFGQVRSSRKMIAWGGTTKRLWFYDLSAGPESWSGNYNVDDADVDGDGSPDYIIPSIWEYDLAGYRNPMDLGEDLGALSRFTAINLLFTTSPLYDPLVTAPGAGGRKIVHINMMQDDPASDGMAWIKTAQIGQTFKSFQPYYPWFQNISEVDPIDSGAEFAFRIFNGLDGSSDCWDPYFTEFAELFCYFDANRSSYFPSYNAADYVVPINAFNTTDYNMGWNSGLLGFADDNWIDGTQSQVFMFDTDYYRSIGYGFTSTGIHEGGHHLGMSHPHDGYDWEYGIDYGTSGWYPAWSGDESHTVMQYISVTNKFGTFDRDNYYRWETAGYLNWSNELLADLQAHPNYATVLPYVNAANSLSNTAVSNFNNWNFLNAATYARRAYEKLAQAAAMLGVTTPDELMAMQVRANPSAGAPRYEDPIRFPDN